MEPDFNPMDMLSQLTNQKDVTASEDTIKLAEEKLCQLLRGIDSDGEDGINQLDTISVLHKIIIGAA